MVYVYCIYCIKTLHDQMHISLFGEAVHLPGIDCLHEAAQVCSPCRSNRDEKLEPLVLSPAFTCALKHEVAQRCELQ